MSKETIVNNEFEQNTSREIEKTYIPLLPERFIPLREQAYPIEQYYLSGITEEFSLRLREELRDGELCYSATLKDRGTVTADGLDRIEITTDVSAETYRLYKSDR